MIPPARRGEGLGWLGMSMTLAMAVGPTLGLWFTDNLSYHVLFLSGAVLSSIALLLTFGGHPATACLSSRLRDFSASPWIAVAASIMPIIR
jgi:MFS family permease